MLKVAEKGVRRVGEMLILADKWGTGGSGFPPFLADIISEQALRHSTNCMARGHTHTHIDQFSKHL